MKSFGQALGRQPQRPLRMQSLTEYQKEAAIGRFFLVCAVMPLNP